MCKERKIKWNKITKKPHSDGAMSKGHRNLLKGCPIAKTNTLESPINKVVLNY